MSIAVPLEDLAATIAAFGSVGYLLSVGDDGRPRANHLTFTAEGPTVRAGLGARTAVNVRARPSVSLLFPPVAGGDGMSLIVDGDAAVEDASDGGAIPTVVVTATWAVRHRPAPA